MFPITLELSQQHCLVVGGGKVASRKVMGLLDCGARVTVVSPQIAPEMAALAETEQISLALRPFNDQDVDGCFLVFAATDNEKVNIRVSEICRNRGVLVNVVDVPELCSFYVPAVVRQGPLSIAISTEGRSPLLARRIREQLEEQFDDAYADYIEMLGEARDIVKKQIPEETVRRKVFTALTDLPLLPYIRNGQQDVAKERIRECIYSWLD